MDTQFYWMKNRVKQKECFVYLKTGSQNKGDYFTKHHPLHYHREMCATYLYMANYLLTIDHKVVHEWGNAVLTPIHTVAITPNCTVVQGCDNIIHTYGHTNNTTLI